MTGGDLRRPDVGSFGIRLFLALSALLLATGCGDLTPWSVEATATPSPRLPSEGIHTPEDLREHLASVSDARKIVIDEDVQVQIRPAPWEWESRIVDFIDAAAIHHIPTMSTIHLDREGEILPRYNRVNGDEAERRLQAVLGDEAVMGEVRLRLLARTYPPDRPVFQFQHGGGLFDRNLGSEMVYELTIWGDGRVVFIDTEGIFREGWIDGGAVLKIVSEAVVLNELEEHYVGVGGTDGQNTFFGLRGTGPEDGERLRNES